MGKTAERICQLRRANASYTGDQEPWSSPPPPKLLQNILTSSPAACADTLQAELSAGLCERIRKVPRSRGEPS